MINPLPSSSNASHNDFLVRSIHPTGQICPITTLTTCGGSWEFLFKWSYFQKNSKSSTGEWQWQLWGKSPKSKSQAPTHPSIHSQCHFCAATETTQMSQGFDPISSSVKKGTEWEYKFSWVKHHLKQDSKPIGTEEPTAKMLRCMTVLLRATHTPFCSLKLNLHTHTLKPMS